MKTIITCLLSLTCLAISRGADLNAPINKVTVYADRALVERSGDFKIKAGSTEELILQDLPAWIDQSSLRARIHPPQAGEIVEVNFRREHLAKPEDMELKKAQAALQEIDDQLADLDDRNRILQARSKQVNEITKLSAAEIPSTAVMRDIPVTYFKEMVEFVDQEQTRITEELRKIGKQRRELIPEKNVRQRRVGELQTRSKLQKGVIEILVAGKQAGTARVVVEYMTPGANWIPAHEIRIEDDKVRMTSFAIITQTTGENWETAELVVSTQRPGDLLSVPKLEALLVSNNGKPLHLAMPDTAKAFNAANAIYLSNNQSFNGMNFGIAEQVYTANLDRQRLNVVQSEETFKKLEKRGTTAQFSVTKSRTINSDGSAVRLPIGSRQLKAESKLVAAPEISLNATRTLDLENTTDAPVLPGRASLFIEGAFMGNTRTEFVGTGEKFTLFAGLADHIRLTRELNHERSELKRGRRTNRIRASFAISVENSGKKTERIRLADRIPISDDRDIEVSWVKVDPDVEPDQEGLIAWDIQVEPGDRREFTLEYTVEYPSDLGKRAVQKGSAAPSSLRKAREQIMDLEMQF